MIKQQTEKTAKIQEMLRDLFRIAHGPNESPSNDEDSILADLHEAEERGEMRDSFVATAKKMLREGKPYNTVIAVYGVIIASEAQQRLFAEGKVAVHEAEEP
jgi:hypothetical protein